ncbi:MAG: GAF domain-containing protein [Armatimonadetes bacterium]|nr:GAF domain-containing protein [Armatimonadota bacterium]
MIAALLTNLSQHWEEQIARCLRNEAVVLTADRNDALDILRAADVELVVVGLESLTELALDHYRSLSEQAQQAVFVCLAPEDVVEQVRTENLFSPDIWLRADATPADTADLLRQAVAQADLTGRYDSRVTDESHIHESEPSPLLQDSRPASQVFEQLLSGLAGGFDRDRLLQTYLNAVAEFVRPGSYSLLWWDDDEDCYAVWASQGMHQRIAASGRLLVKDALPSWYQRNRRVLRRAELAGWADRQTANALGREMDFFGGQLVIPLLINGQLAGLLILGERVTGQPYSSAQIETLYLLASYVTLALQDFELHQQLRTNRSYIKRILQNMNAGVITLDADERIGICNPYAAEILGMEHSRIEESDLRVLPSPLGDYLYAALQVPDEAVTGEEITIWGGKLTLRVSTSALVDDDGAATGAVLIMEDMTAEVDLAEEQRHRERLKVLTGLVGRLVHEIRTPLTAIRTYAELMGDAGDNLQLADFWKNTVTPEINRLDELTRELVSVIQQPEPDFELTQIETLIHQAVEKLQQTEEINESLINVQIPEELPRVVVDPQTTCQALFYLLRHLYAAGRPPLRIRANSSVTDGSEIVVITVSGSSRAKGEPFIDEIFDPVAALQSEHADLGPAISRKIIQNQQGQVQAECKDGTLQIEVSFPAATMHRITPS